MKKIKIEDIIPDDKNFKPIMYKGLEKNYLVNPFGVVVSNKGRQIRNIKQYKSDNGYIKINLTHNKVNINLLVHRLVAMAFISNPQNKETVNHIDGNKENNHYSNLEWSTPLENARHARANRLTVGVAHTEETKKRLSEIHKLLKSGGENSKKVIDKNTGIVYKSAKECFNMTNYKYTYFTQMLS